MDVGKIVVGQIGEIDAMQFGAERAGNGFYLDRIAAHRASSVGSFPLVLFVATARGEADAG